MSYRHISIVIGEGASMRNGLLRFVLEGEGFEVAAEAATLGELSRAFAVHRPDIVVLDDALGTAGLELAHQAVPEAKIVLVWPSAIQPIGADARVDPRSVLRELGPTIERVAGITPLSGITEGFERPDWIGKVKKDPATLREILGTIENQASRPSVTELQRSSRRNQSVTMPASSEKPPAVSPPLETTAHLDNVIHLPEVSPSSTRDAEPELESVADPGTEPEPVEEVIVLVDVEVIPDVEPEAEAEAASEPDAVEVAADDDVAVETTVVEEEPDILEGAALSLVPASSEEPDAVTATEDGDATIEPVPVAVLAAIPEGVAEAEATRESNRKLGSIALGAAAVAGAVVLSLAIGGSKTPVHIAGQAPAGAITIPGTGDGITGKIGLGDPSLHVGRHRQTSSRTGGPSPSGSGGGGTTAGGTTPGGGGGGTPSGGTGGGGGGGGGKGGGGGGGGGNGGGPITPGHSGDHNPHGGPPGQIGHSGNTNAHGGNPHGNGHGNPHGGLQGNGNANGHGSSALVHRHKS